MEKDVFDYIDETEEPAPPSRSGKVWNILTILTLVSALCVGIVYLIVFINPNVGFNPFPPPRMPHAFALDTPTPTPKSVLPPTWTPEGEPPQPPTEVPLPSNTPESLPEEQPIEEVTPEVIGDMPVVLHEGSPTYMSSYGSHPDLGCDWMGVAGQVLDINGAPVTGMFVELGGTLGGKSVGSPTLLGMTGTATYYGPAGYEFKLADQPIASNGTLWIQVLDQAGLPLSEKHYFYTFEDCEQNLIIIFFQKVK